jgi:Flp pilus assembly protein TadD
MAEEAFTKAWEFSEMKRLDVEVKRLSAKVNRIYQDPVWGSEPPEGLEEVDFEFLLQFQKGTEHTKARASILTSYGIYLASTEKPMEAEKALLEAIQLNSKDVLAYINLGNLMDQVGKKEEAEKAYQKSILLDPTNSKAHYNLGLLYAEQGKLIEAEMELTQAIELDSTEEDAKQELDLIRKEINEGKK